MSKNKVVVLLPVLGLAVAGLLLTGPAPAAAQAAKPAEPLQVQETNEAGVVAEFVECKRKEGVLSVRIRFRNTGTQAADWYLVSGGKYDELYVTAEAKKYLVLRDSEQVPLASPGSGGYVRVALKPGGSWLWWAKYPAPPANVKKINYHMPDVAPFEDIPVTDQ
jgi:hypothetical protein